jgi:hypothetical protein
MYDINQHIIGNSEKIKELKQSITLIAKIDKSVLIHGIKGFDSGIAAEAIHRLSSYSKRKLVKIHCPTFSKSEDGVLALTGRMEISEREGIKRPEEGKLTEAHGSTLYFEEIGELDQEVQKFLSGVLKSKRFRIKGDRSDSDIKIRIIASTSKLLGKFKNGTYKNPLHSQVDQTSVKIPTLKKRKEDIAKLARDYIGKYCNEAGIRGRIWLSDNNIDELKLHDWPGDIDELEKRVINAVIKNQDGILDFKIKRSIVDPGSLIGPDTDAINTIFDDKLISPEHASDLFVVWVYINRGNTEFLQTKMLPLKDARGTEKAINDFIGRLSIHRGTVSTLFKKINNDEPKPFDEFFADNKVKRILSKHEIIFDSNNEIPSRELSLPIHNLPHQENTFSGATGDLDVLQADFFKIPVEDLINYRICEEDLLELHENESFLEKWISNNITTMQLIEPRRHNDGKPDPYNYYSGDQITWSGLIYGLDIKRIMWCGLTQVPYNKFLSSHCVPPIQKTESDCKPRFILIGGYGGSGKSTVLLRTAFDLAGKIKTANVFLQFPHCEPLLDEVIKIYKKTKKTICLFIDNIQKYLSRIEAILSYAKFNEIPLVIFGAERLNQLGKKASPDKTFTLKELEKTEIFDLLDKLEEFDCLGTLRDKSYDERVVLFEKYAENQLLICLRSVLEGKNFDKIILDEFDNIPSKDAQKIYLWACILQYIGLYLPIDTAQKKYYQYDSLKKFREEIIEKTKDVLVVSDKYSIDSYFRSRNDTVSEIIVNKEFDNEKEFIEEISEILAYLSKDITDKGYIRYEKLALDIFCSEKVIENLLKINDLDNFAGTILLYKKSLYFIARLTDFWIGKGLQDKLLQLLICLNAKTKIGDPYKLYIFKLLIDLQQACFTEEDFDIEIKTLENKYYTDPYGIGNENIALGLASQLYRKGDPDKAIKLLEDRYLTDPYRIGSEYILLMLSRYLRQSNNKKDYNKAINLLEERLQAEPKIIGVEEVLMSLASVLAKRGTKRDINKAIRLLENKYLENPNMINADEILLSLSSVLRKRGTKRDINKAIRLLEDKYLEYPNMFNSGKILLALVSVLLTRFNDGDLDKAITLLERKYQSEPEMNNAHKILFRLTELFSLRKKGNDIDKAIELLEKRHQKYPEMLNILHKLVYTLNRRYKEEDIDEIIKFREKPLTKLLLLRFKRNKVAESSKIFLLLHDIYPDHPEIRPIIRSLKEFLQTSNSDVNFKKFIKFVETCYSNNHNKLFIELLYGFLKARGMLEQE